MDFFFLVIHSDMFIILQLISLNSPKFSVIMMSTPELTQSQLKTSGLRLK